MGTPGRNRGISFINYIIDRSSIVDQVITQTSGPDPIRRESVRSEPFTKESILFRNHIIFSDAGNCAFREPMFFVPFFQEILLLFILLAASAADIRSRRIPNGLLLAGFLLTALLKLFDGPTGLFISLFAALGLLALASPFFLLRMTGAGDIKTAALVIFACPDQNGILILGYSLILGALWSLWKLWRGKLFRQRFLRFFRYLQEADRKLKRLRTGDPSPGPILPPYYDSRRDGRGITIPFALCIFGGALLRMLQQGGAIL